MSMERTLWPAAIALSLTLGGCLGAQPPRVTPASTLAMSIQGQVTFEVPSTPRTQATLAEAANAATVSLIDPATGNTLSSTVTAANGSFTLTFPNLAPTNGTSYVLEAVKGLSVGGSPNRAGASVVRLRTLLFWNSGWQSLTNSTVNTGIVLSAGTTAIAAIASLKQTAGTPLTLSSLINTVNGGTFTEGGTGLTNAGDFLPVLGLVSNAITLDQDPLAAISLTNGTYALATGVPWINTVTPTIGTPGGTVTLTGSNFDKLDGRNIFWFGSTAAATWSVSADRTTATVTVPASAISGPFVLQQPNGVTQTLDPFYKLHGTVATLLGNSYASFADGPAALAMLNSPHGVAFDGSNLYISDNANYRIRKLSSSLLASTFAGNGTAGFADGTGTNARINNTQQLALDSSGNLYVADINNQRIRKITPGGVVTTLAGSGTAGYADGTGTAAQFNNPHGVAVDSNGNVYVTDSLNQRIRKITPGGTVTTFAGSGTAGYVNGTGTAAQFNSPDGLTVDTAGNVYVSDWWNGAIRKITPAGVVTTLAGSGTPGYADGTGTAAQFQGPHMLAADAAGNLYVPDQVNQRIRKVTPAGVVTTVAGTGVAGFADGPLASAMFTTPAAIAVDPAGCLYVADGGNQRIRVVTP